MHWFVEAVGPSRHFAHWFFLNWDNPVSQISERLESIFFSLSLYERKESAAGVRQPLEMNLFKGNLSNNTRNRYHEVILEGHA